jgi:hypothetical protein
LTFKTLQSKANDDEGDTFEKRHKKDDYDEETPF